VGGAVGFAGPDVEAEGDGLGVEDEAEFAGGGGEGVVVADGEGDIEAAEGGEDGGVGEFSEEVGRGVEVDVLVVVAVEEVAEGAVGLGEVVAAGEGEDAGEELGMAEGEVDGVIGAEAAAVGEERGVGIQGEGEGENFFEDVFFKENVAGDAGGGGDGLVIDGFGIDAIEAEELELARENGGRGGV